MKTAQWKDSCGKELGKAPVKSQPGIEVLSPTAYKELNPVNSHLMRLEADLPQPPTFMESLDEIAAPAASLKRDLNQWH